MDNKKAKPATERITLGIKEGIAFMLVILSLCGMAISAPALQTYLYFVGGVIVAYIFLIFNNTALKYKLKRLLGSHEGQGKILLTANVIDVVNVDLSEPSFSRYNAVYFIVKSAVKNEKGIPTLYYYQGISAPIQFPDLEMTASAEKISAGQKAHWTITRMLAANELWDLFQLMFICLIATALLTAASAYLSYDASQQSMAQGGYCQYVLNQSIANLTTTMATGAPVHA